MPFNIIICGGGLGGLGAAIALRRKGHTVTVLEGAPKLAEVGAGIQIPPNSSRILAAYGVLPDIEKLVVWPKNIHFRRYCTGDIIGRTPLDPRMKEQYDFPYVKYLLLTLDPTLLRAETLTHSQILADSPRRLPEMSL